MSRPPAPVPRRHPRRQSAARGAAACRPPPPPWSSCAPACCSSCCGRGRSWQPASARCTSCGARCRCWWRTAWRTPCAVSMTLGRVPVRMVTPSATCFPRHHLPPPVAATATPACTRRHPAAALLQSTASFLPQHRWMWRCPPPQQRHCRRTPTSRRPAHACLPRTQAQPLAHRLLPPWALQTLAPPLVARVPTVRSRRHVAHRSPVAAVVAAVAVAPLQQRLPNALACCRHPVVGRLLWCHGCRLRKAMAPALMRVTTTQPARRVTMPCRATTCWLTTCSCKLSPAGAAVAAVAAIPTRGGGSHSWLRPGRRLRRRHHRRHQQRLIHHAATRHSQQPRCRLCR